VHWLKAAAGVEVRGIDGLYLHGDTFIAIQNGTRPERIVGMSSDLQQLAVLESGWDGLGEPTHGALLDGKFYFLANTGWEAYDEHGAKKPGLPPVISTIWSLPLSTLP
jgi:hypothetical protein